MSCFAVADCSEALMQLFVLAPSLVGLAAAFDARVLDRTGAVDFSKQLFFIFFKGDFSFSVTRFGL